MVCRIYVEKRKELAGEARELKEGLRTFLGISALEDVRILNRYDVENIDEKTFSYAVRTVLSEPQQDITYEHLPEVSDQNTRIFAVEYLPGQYDQRADSAAQCIQILSQGERPAVRTARVYILTGCLTEEDMKAVRKYVINPVDSREASLDRPRSLKLICEIPTTVETLTGFTDMDEAALSDFLQTLGLAMDPDDLKFCQAYFREENRDPTITEIRMIDTYWSDHCRHTTFNTIIDNASFEDDLLEAAWKDYLNTRRELNRTRPVTLMDLGTLGARYLKSRGELEKLDESEEINACTVRTKVTIDGKEEDWLLLFKNETHNHPTEIEPFGGAATCIGGAIRDPLSGRSYVYAAMRVTGAADPLKPVSETLPGKLPQRKLVTTAAAGYSSYGNQIGLATGQVDEIYHEGYAAKRLEIGAVIGACPEANVRRECPSPGDVVILLGGRTGRDGCGGATGSSKSHTLKSLENCGAEVQKGNAPEERKLQRLFRNSEACRLIKRCNDFGAGGVSVAVGELADGLDIDLNAVPRKYDGLDGTELAISESQERMAVVVAPEDAARFCELADAENLESTVIAGVKAEPYLSMTWNGKRIVHISRAFLNTNGAEKHIAIRPAKIESFEKALPSDFISGSLDLASDLNVCSKRGLSERFDSTIGAGTVLMPFGGINQLTPSQAMVNKISVETGFTGDCSAMSWGYNPFITEKSPYHGAYLAVVESLCKLIAVGADRQDTYLTFQEFFEKPGSDPQRWGQPLAALLGALEAQKDLHTAAIGGKDSMSGSFEALDVPPTLVSFAVTTIKSSAVISNDFKKAGHKVLLLTPAYNEHGLPDPASLMKNFDLVTSLIAEDKVISAYTPTYGGIAEAVMKMCFGNTLGFAFEEDLTLKDLFGYSYGSFILEMSDDPAAIETLIRIPEKTEGKGRCRILGTTGAEEALIYGKEKVRLSGLLDRYESRLEPVYSCCLKSEGSSIPSFSFRSDSRQTAPFKAAVPKVLIPVFPGTNCEYDTARAWRDAGAEPEIFVVRNLTASAIADSVSLFAEKVASSQIIFIPGGFSGGDEPDGSGKFITAFFRNSAVSDAVNDLMTCRGGLMAGICNGFQALIKLGLVPFGEITDTDDICPTLTFNTIGRHQSRLVRTRIASNMSPWLMDTEVDDIYTVPISHGEGRFIASDALLHTLAEKGQIATQYVDLDGRPTDDIRFNPNNSVCAIEGITSPDGRIFGKMGHSERVAADLYRNVPGNYDLPMFRSAVRYFK